MVSFSFLEIDSPPSQVRESTTCSKGDRSIPESKSRAGLQSMGTERRKLRALLCDQRENIDR